jgi:hypothetical protein
MSYSQLQEMLSGDRPSPKGWRTTSNMKPCRNLLARARKGYLYARPLEDPKGLALPDVTD